MNDEDYRNRLTKEQYDVTRNKATERPFTGEYWNTTENGIYHCVCCGAELFSSRAKYDAGCGWPSFWEPINPEQLDEENDFSLGMARTEIMCVTCGAHLGHSFPDGPEPTGLRYCINSLSLQLEKEE